MMEGVNADAAGHFLQNMLSPPAESGRPFTHTFDPSPPDPSEAVAWLRARIENDLQRWRPLSRMYGERPRQDVEDALDRVADCEAKLAILDEHYILWPHDTSEAYGEFSVVSSGGAGQDHGCVRCHYYGQGGVKGYGFCRTVRLLALAYRHRDGYSRYWGEPVTHTITEAGQ